ncbi:ankyrin repeat and SOCS box protein 2-like isoform X2 [Alosa sapidissima]|uniref:ankyrin repeat and SOCS box protein 2-like isoform X2 n=1 Tax=Alosa sapidissima TaxID=34773 RepID=UPI001C09DBE3|nr:ankyrin repeat and SOCS box protein 2-like isoform X2 [Alosa sapidissima]
MASASVSMSSSSGSTLGFEDYSLYSNMSDDQLLQLAIERSLMEGCTSTPAAEPPRAPQTAAPPARPNAVIRRRPPARIPEHEPEPPPCPSNPPSHSHSQADTSERKTIPPSWTLCRDIKQELEGSWVSQYTTGYGKRMVAYRRLDGTLIRTEPEPDAVVEPLVKAIWDGDASLVRTLVRKPDVNLLKTNQQGWIPMHEAAYYGQVDCLRAILGAQPGMLNKRTLKEQTALMLAVERGFSRCMECLLERGADPDIQNKDKETPLFKACEKENPEMVAILLNNGASVNKLCTQGWTALHETVSHNHLEIAEMLLKAGAKVNIVNQYGITPLFVAAQAGHVDILRLLLKHGADINSQAADGATALYEACKNGHEDIVKFLLSQKADANKPGKTGLLPIHIAAEKGYDGIIEMLIPATSRQRVRRCGISPIHLAVERDRDDVLEILIEAGFDVNAPLSEDRSRLYEDRRSSALYFAVINNNIEATTMLLEAGANPNLDVLSPVLVSIRMGSIEIFTKLVDHGADVNVYIPNYPTNFPATVMFAMKYLPMLKYLLDHGCDAQSCFNCSYGNSAHPPIKVTGDERRDLHYRMEEAQNTCIEFCEMISTPSISRWAGPIIDVLLDYVGNVKLCARLTEHLDSFIDWKNIKEKSEPPRTLMHLCRIRVRHQIGCKRLQKIDKLPIPPRLIKFLKYENRTEGL